MTKRIVIPRTQLPDINFLTQEYQVRYRITTEDRNRFSSWTPIFGIGTGFEFTTSGSAFIEKHTGYSSIIWNPVTLTKDGNNVGELGTYDLWIRWGTEQTNGEWQYKERTGSTSLNVLKPTSPAGINTVSVEIYYPGRPTLRKATYDVLQSNSGGKINLTNDVITLPTINVLKTGYKILYLSTLAIGGLTNNTEYYARMLTSNTMSLHPTKADAENNVNKINLTSHENSVGFFTWVDCTVCDYLLYSNYNFSPV